MMRRRNSALVRRIVGRQLGRVLECNDFHLTLTSCLSVPCLFSVTSGTGVLGYRVAVSLLEAGHKDVRVGIVRISSW